jgi:hypothetical protein
LADISLVDSDDEADAKLAYDVTATPEESLNPRKRSLRSSSRAHQSHSLTSPSAVVSDSDDDFEDPGEDPSPKKKKRKEKPKTEKKPSKRSKKGGAAGEDEERDGKREKRQEETAAQVAIRNHLPVEETRGSRQQPVGNASSNGNGNDNDSYFSHYEMNASSVKYHPPLSPHPLPSSPSSSSSLAPSTTNHTATIAKVDRLLPSAPPQSLDDDVQVTFPSVT